MPTRERRARALGVPVEQLPDRRGRHGRHVRGGDHPRWNEDRMLSEHGYVKLRVGPEHPLADPNGYAYEHLVVWCAAGNPPPPDGFLLHHRNEDKADNKLRNLELIERPQHSAHHIAERARDAGGRLLPKSAGRLLDGVEHNGMPEVARG